MRKACSVTDDSLFSENIISPDWFSWLDAENQISVDKVLIVGLVVVLVVVVEVVLVVVVVDVLVVVVIFSLQSHQKSS